MELGEQISGCRKIGPPALSTNVTPLPEDVPALQELVPF